MRPFLHPFPQQNQVRGGNGPSINQFPGSSSALPNQFGFNNPQFMMQTMGGFNNQNALLGSLIAQQHLIQGLQNNLMSALSQQGIMPQLHGPQLNFLGALQNPNLMSLQQGGLLGRPTLGQNQNHMLGFSPNGLPCSQNPIFHPNSQLRVMSSGNPNPGFLGNGSTQAAHCLSSSTGLETQVSSQKLQETILPIPVQNNQPCGWQWPQMTNGQAGGKNLLNNSSENVDCNNFKPKFNQPGKKEPSHMRFQKSQSYNPRNACQKERPFPRNDRRGQRQRKERNTNFSANNNNTFSTLRKRHFAVIYSENEIQQWRSARKKNFPTRSNIEKKLSPSSAKNEDIDSDAKVRRQQLKEVLAKQAELGVEVAEIPSIYLTEPGEEETPINGNTRNPYQGSNNKRGRFRRNKRNANKKHDATPPGFHEPEAVKKKEPTLLRKLLNADIRRDKSQLLQAFRFMLLNSFFKDSPNNNKPLVFPLIIGKDTFTLLESSSEKKPPQNKEEDDSNAEEIGAVEYDNGDVLSQPFVQEFLILSGEKSEEGEITD